MPNTQEIIYDSENDICYIKGNQNQIQNSEPSGFGEYWARMFDFSGCTPRRRFWGPLIVYGILGILISFLITGAIIDTSYRHSNMNMAPFVWFLLSFIFNFPSLSLQVRRLHDANFSGALIFICFILHVVALICGLLGDRSAQETGEVLLLIELVLSIIILFICFSPSDYKNNHYYESEQEHIKTPNTTTPVYTKPDETIKTSMNLDNLEKAAKLYKDKLITKAEFEKIKKQCLTQQD